MPFKAQTIHSFQEDMQIPIFKLRKKLSQGTNQGLKGHDSQQRPILNRKTKKKRKILN